MKPCPFPECDCAEKCKEGAHGFNVECLRADLWMLNSREKDDSASADRGAVQK